ncbi:MAG: hypothetical protein KUL82_11295 [Bdellovibrio sp.]|nr:hypothetical protein [Bdellovibrio sp.]
MKYLVFILMVLVGLWSFSSHASYNSMSFKIRSLGPHQYEYSSVWNPVTEEATLRVGLVLDKIDPFLQDKPLSFATAHKAEFVALDLPEVGEDCEMISHWQFEYSPGLPHYLMYLTLKGSGCKKVSELFDVLQMRLRFTGVSLLQIEPIDVAVDISR